MIRDAVERLVLEEGERAVQAVHARGDRGRPARLQARVRGLLVPGRYRSSGFTEARYANKSNLPKRAQRDLIIHGAYEAVVDAGRPLDDRPARLIGLGLALLQRHPLRAAGHAVDPLHPDADLQRQDQRRRLLRDRAAADRGQLGEPRRRSLLVLVPLDADVHAPHGLPARGLARPADRAATSRRSSPPTPCRATSPRAAASTSTGRSPAS